MKVLEDKLGLANRPHYVPKHDWSGCYIQWGGSGIVFQRDEERNIDTYKTAFFEVFPINPQTFLRGEGKTIDEAEDDVWKKYQRILKCDWHKISRKGYKNGSGVCTRCGLFVSHIFSVIPYEDDSIFTEMLGESLKKMADSKSQRHNDAWDKFQDLEKQLEAIRDQLEYISNEYRKSYDDYMKVISEEFNHGRREKTND
jgi:hypothetical protein